MSVKTRLGAIILSGLLLGLVAVQLQRSSLPVERAVLSDDDAVRNEALRRLQSIQNSGEKGRIIGEIAKGVKSANPRTRVFALYALRKSGWKGPRIIGPMIASLSDRNPKVRDEASVGLREEGPSVFPQIFWTMGNPAVRDAARDIARDVPPETVPVFEKALTIRGQQRAAAFFLSKIDRADTIAAARHLAPALAANLKSTDTVLALNCAFALNTIDPKDPRPYPFFLKSLSRPNWEPWDVRGWDALEALTKAPAYKERLVPMLKDALATAPDGWIKGRRFKRPAIGDALNTLAPLPTSLPALAALLKSPSPVARWRAVYAIGSAPVVDEQALSPLAAALDDRDQVVAARAVWALDRLGVSTAERAADTIYPKLIATFQRVTANVPGFWMSATSAISNLGQRALPLTFDAVRAGRLAPDKAAAIVRALSREDDPAKSLQKPFVDANPDVRLVAALALVKFAPNTAGLQAELEHNLPTRQGYLQTDIRKSLDDLARRKKEEG